MYKRAIFGVGLILIIFVCYKSYQDFKEIDKKIKTTKGQIFALEEISKIHDTNLLIKKIRGLTQLDYIKKENKLDKLELIVKRVKFLASYISNKDIKTVLDNSLKISTSDKSTLFFEYSKIINILNSHIIKVATTYKMFDDFSGERINEISSLIYAIPNLEEALGKLRGIGSFILTKKDITEQEIFILKDNISNFYINYKRLELKSNYAKHLIFDFENFKLNIESLFAKDYKYSPIEYFTSSSLIIDSLDEYYNQINKNIAITLNDKMIKLENSNNALSLEFLLTILIILFTTIFTYIKINSIERVKLKANYESKILNELYTYLHNCHSVKQMCDISIKFLVEKTNAANGIFYLVDYKNSQLNLASTYNISSQHISHILSLDEGIFAEVLKDKKIKTISEDGRFRVNFGTFKAFVNEIITIPVVNDEDVIGILQLSYINEKILDEYQSQLVKIIANNISKMIKNEENQKYLDLIDKYVITSTTNKDGVINYASQAFCDITGYAKNELIGKSHNILRDENIDEKVYKDLWKTIKDGDTWIKEISNRKKDGSTYWVKATISPEFGFYGDIIGYNSIKQDISDKKLIEKISITDSLTNLYNRRYFDEQFPKLIKITKRESVLLNFLIIDVDHFKQYNDTYGHHSGDIALVKVANVLKDTFQRPNDFIFRLGGEEFAVLFSTTQKESSIDISNKLLLNMENEDILHESSLVSNHITLSAGLYIIENSDDSNLENIYQNGDKLLYKAKNSGRNRVVY